MVRTMADLKHEADLTGRVCVITGGNRGIGRAAATELARRNATVVILSRFHANGVSTAGEIAVETGNASVQAYPCDLASLSSIRECAASLRRDFPAIHVLVNNAGTASRRRQLTADGHERTFGVNHLGTFLLTNLLLESLAHGAPSRIVVVSSEAHQATRLDFEDLQNEQVYFGLRAYAQSKLCNIFFANELHRRLHGTGIVANAMHPGFIATNLVNEYYPLRFLVAPIVKRFARTPLQGADSIVWLAASDEGGYLSGAYVIDRKPRPTSLIAMDAVLAKRLWETSAELTSLAPVPAAPPPFTVHVASGSID